MSRALRDALTVYRHTGLHLERGMVELLISKREQQEPKGCGMTGQESSMWWTRIRIIRFVVVAADLLWRVIKKGADVKDLITAIRISWSLTTKERSHKTKTRF